MELLPAWMHGVTEEWKKRAEEELGETEEVKPVALKHLRELINEEEGFEPLMTDAFLVRFLRAKKYDVKRAYKTLKNYYGYKVRYAGLITDYYPSELRDILDTDSIFVSPKRCPLGCGILILFIGSFDVETHGPEKLIAGTAIAAEIGIETEGSQVCGSQIVIDMKGMSWSRMKYYSSPVLLSRIFRGLQDCWPYRVNAIHATNEPPYYGYVYAIIKTMLSKKLRDRIHFHGEDMESLHKFLPPETLPKDLGGTLGDKDFMNFKSVLHENEHIMEKLNRYVFQGVKSAKYDCGTKDDDHSLVIPKALQST